MGVKCLTPLVQHLQVSSRLETEVEQFVSDLNVQCALDGRSGMTLLRHRHPETLRDLCTRIADGLRRKDKLKRALKVYTDFFEEHNQPETKMEEAVRIFKAFPWMVVLQLFLFLASAAFYVRNREGIFDLAMRWAPWGFNQKTWDSYGTGVGMIVNFVVLVGASVMAFKKIGDG